MKKRLLSMLLVVCMIMSMIPTVFAEAPNVAEVEGIGYDTFADAWNAATAGQTINLLAPITVAAGETLTLDKDVTITYTSSVPGEDMITNRGTLVIDGATLAYTNTDTSATNVTVSTISCEPGSNLTVNSGSVVNNSANNAAGGIYAYAIDLLTNGNLGEVSATINGGEITSTNYMAIRQFVNGEVCKNILTVNGGTIKGGTRGINIQIDNNMAYTTITGGSVEGANYSLCFITGSENISVTGGQFKGAVYYGAEGIITGGTFDAEPYEGYVAEGYEIVANDDGTYSVAKELPDVAEVDGVGYDTLEEAIAAGGNVKLLADVILVERLDVARDLTIDLNGHTISGAFEDGYGMIYVKKGYLLTIEGEGKITSSGTYAIGNYGFVTLESGTVESTATYMEGGEEFAYAALYNFYYDKDTYGSLGMSGGNVTEIWNSGMVLMHGGCIDYLDNSGALTVIDGTINEIYARDGGDAPEVPNAGTLSIKDISNVSVPDGYKLVENADGTYGVVVEDPDVAEVDGVGYKTFADAWNAATAGQTINLLAPITVAAGETLTLDKDVTITYTSSVPGEDMITNRGTLVIDGATLVYTNTDTSATNVTVSTISCEPGSNLTVNSGSVVNNSANNAASEIYAYAIDLLTNGNLGEVSATINGGEITSTNYMAIRQFVNGEVCKNILTVNGGTIKGATRGINIQLKNNMAYTTITGGSVEGANYSLCFITGSENISVTGGQFKGAVYYGAEGIITGGTFDAEPYEGYVAEGYEIVANDDGTYSVAKELPDVAEVDGIGYKTFADALNAAAAGQTINLLAPITVAAGETLTLDKAVTITYTSSVPGEDMITNRGTLVIDGAILIYTNTDTSATNVTVSTISCEPGSGLTVNSGSVVNNSANNAAGGIYAYAIDLVTNGNLGDVSATINGGEITSTNYMAIRQFVNGEVCKNSLIVNGGTIKGATRGINIQLKNNMAYTTISGGVIEGGDYSLCFLTTSENLTVTGGQFKGAVWYSGTDAFIEGGTFDEAPDAAYVVEGYVTVENADGTYGVVIAKTLEITTQPVSVTVANGATAKASVKASGDGLTYQWYFKTASGSSFLKSSQTTATYSTTMNAARDGYKVYCVVTDSHGNSVQSNTVTLNMAASELKIITQPVSVTVVNGATAKTTVKATGDGLKYQWYYTSNASDSTFSKSSLTVATYTAKMGSAIDGRKLYCVITDKYGNSVTSNTVTLTMSTTVKITSQTVDVKVANGETATASVKATGEGLTYQWYYKSATATGFNKSSQTTATYSTTMNAARDGYQVYCVVKDKYGASVKSNIVTLSMY